MDGMDKIWYKNGLNFKCTECGKCCSGSSGYVWVSPEEIQIIANHLEIPVDAFVKKYIRLVGERYSLVERKRGLDYDCVFLQGKRCCIYEVRPKQCKTFPWWQQNLESQETWNEVANECEGVDSSAPVVELNTILSNLQ